MQHDSNDIRTLPMLLCVLVMLTMVIAGATMAADPADARNAAARRIGNLGQWHCAAADCGGAGAHIIIAGASLLALFDDGVTFSGGSAAGRGWAVAAALPFGLGCAFTRVIKRRAVVRAQNKSE